MKKTPIQYFAILIPFASAFGCSQATDVSVQPSDAELKAAAEKRAKAASERTDLTPEQRAGLERYNQGGAPGRR